MSQVSLLRIDKAGRLLIGGFLLLGLIVAMTVWFSARQRADANKAQHILLVKDQLSNLLSSVRQGESGQRGYLLTNNPAYLKQYQYAMTALPEEFQALDNSIGNGPEKADYAAVKQIISDKLNELHQTISLNQAGNQAGALAIVNTDIGVKTMMHLRDSIGVMQATETQNLAAGEAEDATDGWILQAAITFTVFFTLLMAFLAIRDNQQQTSQLRATQAALRTANEVLEQKVKDRTATLEASEAALREANATLEQKVAERSGELDRIFKLSSDILCVSNAEGRFLRLNPAWEQITGHSAIETIGKYNRDFIHPDDLQASLAADQQMHEGATILNFENRYRRADGSYCWLSWRGVPLHEENLAYSVARDITEEKLKDEQLRQSQKMEIVGQLTGGVAHDFNNLLTIILGSLELLQRGLVNAEPKLQRRVDNAMDGARRAATLTQRLLAFARQQPLEPKATDVNRLVAGMSDMLHRTLGEHVALEFVGSAGIWPALADGNQLENALLNLAVNARDAMPGGGRLTIETQNMYLDEDYAATREDVEPGQYVLIAVTDSGCGMAKDVCAKVFEPFFTTKPAGEGTGLGLAQVYGFIKQSGGHIAIYSEPGEGTSVKLYLPRLRGAMAADLAAVASEAPGDFGPRGQGQTILVVEDEEGVRNFSVEILEDLGYTVLAAGNADAALRVFDANPDIKILFTDVVLTGSMNGRLLADKILSRKQDIMVLFTTGYTRNAIIHHGRLDDGIHFLGKPFTASALAQKIQKLLGSISANENINQTQRLG